MACSCSPSSGIVCPAGIAVKPEVEVFQSANATQGKAQISRTAQVPPESFQLFVMLTSRLLPMSSQKIGCVRDIRPGVIRNPLAASDKF